MQLPQRIPVGNPTFQLPGLLGVLYGIAAPVRFPSAGTSDGADPAPVSFAGIEVVPDDQVMVMSSIGTPILHPITLLGGTYRHYDSRGRITDSQMSDFRLPITSVMELSLSKSIVKTQVSASSSSVKEVYTSGDWDIRISGIVLDEEKHPQGVSTVEDMEEWLNDYASLADSIAVDSDVLARKGIDRLVIRSLSFTQIPGKPRMVGYQLQCDSDAPIELLIQ